MTFHCKLCDTKLQLSDEIINGPARKVHCRICNGHMTTKEAKAFPYFPIRLVTNDIFDIDAESWLDFENLIRVEDFPKPLGGEVPLNDLELLH